MSDELLSDEELAEAEIEAGKILAEPAKKYKYLGDYKGGPRNLDPEDEKIAALELVTARMVVDEIAKRQIEATIQLYEKMKELAEAEVPIAIIAKYSGLEHRGSVYRAIRRLPALMREMEKPT